MTAPFAALFFDPDDIDPDALCGQCGDEYSDCPECGYCPYCCECDFDTDEEN